MSKTGFSLNPRLEADSIPVMDLRLSAVRLINDSRFPWIILIPRVAGAEELFDLNRSAQNFLMEEMAAVAKAMAAVSNPEKMNIGALGNIVRQLHVHVIARFPHDEAWPGPAWGVGTVVPYSDKGEAFLSLLRPQIIDEMNAK